VIQCSKFHRTGFESWTPKILRASTPWHGWF